ncbi:MAG: GNAT family N-acetyltransferase [Anaerolineae bacterium]|nr:GNAT family N-acetyltransferase [Anaerolineae bacterium]
MTRVKVCGVKTLEDALLCAEAGADMLGLNFYPPSPRSLEPDAARAITDGLRAELGEQCPVLIGVFVNETTETLAEIIDIAGLDAAQLSGYETPETLASLKGRGIKAIRPQNLDEALKLAEMFLRFAPEDDRLPALLLDAYHEALYGGTGEEASIEVALALKDLTPRLMLAGGLKPDNVTNRVRAIHPWGVDVASGVESVPGVKDRDRVIAFIQAAQNGSRPAYIIDAMQPDDWPQVAAIYAAGIATQNATFETDVPAYDTWDRAHRADCRLVARDGDQVLGWAALSRVSDRCVYGGVAENSIYIAPTARGRGIGKALLKALVDASETAGIWTLQTGIFPENVTSIGLHKACGFREVGIRERIGQMDGVWRDVVMMERRSAIVGT